MRDGTFAASGLRLTDWLLNSQALPLRKESGTVSDASKTVEVTRRIAAPAGLLFEILASPQRHMDFDGSGMLRGAVVDRAIMGVGETFTMKMHRLGRDYLMINYVVEFETNRRISWQPAPGDLETAGGDPSRVGVPSGYRWGYILTPESDHVTLVTEVFDCGSEENKWILQREDGSWINGTNSVRVSMSETLEKLESVAIRGGASESAVIPLSMDG
jgi:hypothetical protein